MTGVTRPRWVALVLTALHGVALLPVAYPYGVYAWSPLLIAPGALYLAYADVRLGRVGWAVLLALLALFCNPWTPMPMLVAGWEPLNLAGLLLCGKVAVAAGDPSARLHRVAPAADAGEHGVALDP